MIINRKTLRDGIGWIALSLCALVGVWVASRAAAPRPGGASGGSGAGLAAGIVGTAMIAFAMALIVRKTWRTLAAGGGSYAWLHGHVWLGFVSYFVIGIHAGWRWGGPLTWWLMLAFTLVWASGVLGLLIQNLVPRLMSASLPRELLYEQIRTESLRNLGAARELAAVPVAVGGAAPSAAVVELHDFFNARVLPFLAHGARGGPDTFLWPVFRGGPAPEDKSLSRQTTARPPPADAFARLRARHPSLSTRLDGLEACVRRHEQHLLQRRLHWVLHGWLLIHVPLSVVMVVLVPVHAVFAMRY